MPTDGSAGETTKLRCPYCLRPRSTDNAMMSWCIGKCESDPDQDRQARGFVEADEIINSGEAATEAFGHE